MSSTLIWPDVHNRTRLLASFLEKNGDKFDRRIFLGDYFDQWHDTPADVKRTALMVRELMQDSRNVLLEGNHDTAYRFNNQAAHCPGHTPEKARAVRDVLNFTHWEQLKLFEFHQGFLFSHAGVHPRYFEHPVDGVTIDGIAKECQKAVDAMRCNTMHPVYNWSELPMGGITWLRWGHFKPIPGINQVVGHTILDQPQVIYSRSKCSNYHGVRRCREEVVTANWMTFQNNPPKKLHSINYNLDTNNRFFAIVEDGKLTIHLTLDYL